MSFQRDDPKVFANQLVDVYEWAPVDSKKVWCFGPEETGPNCFVDMTQGIQYLNEIKDSVVGAF